MDPLNLLHQPAPLFSLPALDGALHHLEAWQGRIVVLNFWSAECPWAERGDQELLSYLPGWGEKVILCTIACNANEPVNLLAQTAVQRGLPLVLHDPQQQVTKWYGAQTTPHLFVVDAAGLLRYQGALNDRTFRQRTVTRFYLRDAVNALLAGQSPDPDHVPPYGCTIVRQFE
jgi:peroxiredoxin